MSDKANEAIDRGELLSLTSDIVAAHASNNAVSTADLSGLIETVFRTLQNLNAPSEESVVELKPAVPIKRSVTDDHIVCLEDGRKLKMLKRHLKITYDMTPAEYRQKWGLPRDYPMVAPSYAAKRRELAKKIGLGRKAASAKTAGKGGKAKGGKTRK